MPPGSTILVTGCEINLRRTLALILRRAGYAAFTAESARQALQRLETRPYDLVILDLSIADVNGLPLLTAIHQGHPDLPILILTGFTAPESVIEAGHTRTLEYLVKPIDPPCILARVREMLRERSSPPN